MQKATHISSADLTSYAPSLPPSQAGASEPHLESITNPERTLRAKQAPEVKIHKVWEIFFL
jgi:hypothetical protein